MNTLRPRKFRDLISVGPAIERDFEMLGVRNVEDLAKRDPEVLYKNLCRKTGARQDPCVLDVFRAAVAQARDPKLPAEQCVWWYWSRVRKEQAAQKSK
jgi:predicted RecB family nuclease